MENFQAVIILMFAAILLVGLSQKVKIPYPIGLVLGGVIIGFTPIQYEIYFDPNLILIIVLPPILYYAAFEISFREFRSNLQEILSLALGLVIFNTFVIGIIFHWIFPDLSLALAFAFGAIVSPPDAIAATSILKRFSINTKLLTILEGESLINDASALVLYKMAVVALLSGVFSVTEASIEFVTTVTGGIVVGVAMGYLLQNISRIYLQPVLGVVFSFTIPYVTYIIAIYLGVSGVLAVVVNGLIGSKILLRHHSSSRRIFGHVSWDIFTILLNCFVFILLGLQLQTLTFTMTWHQILIYMGDAFLITLAMIIVRMGWVYTKSTFTYFKLLRLYKNKSVNTQIFRESALVGWAGMRGIVSLTAALALPYTLPNGQPLEGRNEVVFIVFMVILLTLLIPGLTLAPLLRKLKIHHVSKRHQGFLVRKQLIEVARQTILHLHSIQKVSDEECRFLTSHFDLNSKLLEFTNSGLINSSDLEHAKSLVIKEQRKKLLQIWEEMEIDDKLLSQLEQELDLEEINMTRAELT